jgi:hypothetical protein
MKPCPVCGRPLETDTDVLLFQTVGTAGKTWALSQSQVEAWTVHYPNLNVFRECQKAAAWLTANPSRRKTSRGMARFLVGWLNRQTDEFQASHQVRRLPVGYAYRDAGDWWDECKRLHDGTCEHRMRHHLRLELDAAKEQP